MTFYLTTQLKIENPNLLNSGANYFLRPASHFFGRTYQIVENEAQLQNSADTHWLKTAFMIGAFIPGLILGTIFRIFSFAYAEVRAGFSLAYKASITPPTSDYPADKVATDLAFFKSIAEATELQAAEDILRRDPAPSQRMQQLAEGTLKLANSDELSAAHTAAKAKLEELRKPKSPAPSEEKKSDEPAHAKPVATGFDLENPSLFVLIGEYTDLFNELAEARGKGVTRRLDEKLTTLGYQPFHVYATLKDPATLKAKIPGEKVDALVEAHGKAVERITELSLQKHLP